MTLLVLSPDYASHYGPLSVVAQAARSLGERVVVATGPALPARVVDDGFEWRPLRLGADSNTGVVDDGSGIRRFLDATRDGPVATIRRQALDREHDLLWHPEQVGRDIADLCEQIEPDEVLVDHVSFGSTLGMHATGRPFMTLVPGHPSQLPVGAERYGVPTVWPRDLTPDPEAQTELLRLADRVTRSFTTRWNDALAVLAPERDPVEDAFRVHGRRVLYNAVSTQQDPERATMLPDDHRFVGPLVRTEALPDGLADWLEPTPARAHVYVALGTFLSHRGDVLVRIADALRRVDARAAIATGATPVADLGPHPADWSVAPLLPQVALLRGADIAIHHGGNNSVQESSAAGAHQIVLPFSTDQFANGVDLERRTSAVVLSPNEVTVADLADTIERLVAAPRPSPLAPPRPEKLAAALYDRTPTARPPRPLNRGRATAAA